jgi:RNA polymerase sigma-70 factor (ECF subfamily)
MGADDKALIIGLKRGDMHSFGLIFEKYRRAVFAYARRILCDDALAEDCVQDVFLELARRADSIDIARGVKGWLFRVARNRAVDMLRRRSREAGPEEADAGEDGGALPDEAMVKSERSACILSEIARLSKAEREIVVMRFFGGLTFAEAEEATGVPLNTLIWRCRRALEKLALRFRKEL